MTYFAAALARTGDGWTGRELDLAELNDLEALAEELRDLVEGEDGPALLLIEEDDEYVAVVRVEGGSLDEPRVFLSDRRAVLGTGVTAMLWEDVAATDDDEQDEEEEEEGTRAVAEPVGDASLLTDLGTSAQVLLELCAEEGLLPADVLTGVAERAGFLDVLDGLREA